MPGSVITEVFSAPTTSVIVLAASTSTSTFETTVTSLIVVDATVTQVSLPLDQNHVMPRGFTFSSVGEHNQGFEVL